MTLWINRLHMVVTAEEKDTANTYAASLTENPADVYTFEIPISADGQLPATHYGTSTVVTEDMRVQMWQDFMTGVAPMSTRYWWMQSPSGAFVDSNVPGSTSTNFDECIAALGLKRVIFEEE